MFFLGKNVADPTIKKSQNVLPNLKYQLKNKSSREETKLLSSSILTQKPNDTILITHDTILIKHDTILITHDQCCK
jgi:hypothetical protein